MISLTIPGLLVSANGSRVFSGQGAAVDLGAQLTGGTGPTVTFTLTNESSTPITLSNEVVPTGFRAAGTVPTTVPAGGTATFMVQLDTSTSGGKAGTLTFGSSDTSMPTFSIPLSGTVGTNFVRNLYEQILRRDPDQAGQDYWNNLILTGQSTPGQITAGFVNSTEYRSIRITDLYSQILGRGIDSGGLQYWLGYFAGGGSLEQIEAGFYGSDEYFNAHGGTNSSVVNSFYQALAGPRRRSSRAVVLGQLHYVGHVAHRCGERVYHEPGAAGQEGHRPVSGFPPPQPGYGRDEFLGEFAGQWPGRV